MTGSREPLILIVDDDAEFRDSLKVLVATRGYRVESYASGVDFLQSPRLEPKCCLILDLHMPEISGVEVLQAIRSRGITIPVIAITGAGSPRLKVDALRAGALEVLDKPLQKEQLFDAVSRALR